MHESADEPCRVKKVVMISDIINYDEICRTVCTMRWK